ncbi:MAG: hypothetical protein AAF357_01415 [Verrucomicrobiota bacterium]
MSNIAPRTLVVCEEALKDFSGHWFEYSRAVAEMNRAVGVDVKILAHTDVSSEVRQAIDAEPFFTHTNWDGIYYHSQAWRRYLGILKHNFRVYRAVSGYLNRISEPIDCIFAPTVVRTNFGGCCNRNRSVVN